MEDVLDVYHRPYVPEKPLVCIDESSKQQIVETRQPLPAEPGQPERYDYEYERHGVNNLFMLWLKMDSRELISHRLFRVTYLASGTCSLEVKGRYWCHDTHTISHRRRQMF